MKIVLDTNVVSYFFFSQNELANSAREVLSHARGMGEVVINSIVYAEIAAMDEFEESSFDRILRAARIVPDWTPLEPKLWLRAGFLYGQYARSPKPKKGSDRRLLADFLTLAHLEARADLLLTFDNALVQVANDPRVVYAPDWKSA